MMNALERRSTFALSSIFALRMLGLFMIIPVFSVVGQSYQYATPALIGLAVGIYGLSQVPFYKFHLAYLLTVLAVNRLWSLVYCFCYWWCNCRII